MAMIWNIDLKNHWVRIMEINKINPIEFIEIPNVHKKFPITTPRIKIGFIINIGVKKVMQSK